MKRKNNGQTRIESIPIGTNRVLKGRISVLTAALLLILNSGYYLSTIRDSYIPLFLMMFAGVVFFFSTYDGKIRKCGFSRVALLILMLALFLSTIVNFSVPNVLSAGRVSITFICAYIIARSVDSQRLMICYSSIIRWMIIASLLLFIVSKGQFASFLPSIRTSSGRYYNLIFITQRPGANRLNGAFWEPGVFASHILFSMLFEVYFLKSKVKITHIVLYILGIYFTGSAAGLLILAFVLLGYIFKITKWNQRRIAQFMLFGAFIAGFLLYERIFMWLSEANPQIFSKLTEASSPTFYTRFNCPKVNLQLFWEKPFFGWGFTDAATQYASYMNYRLVAQTSTATQIMSAVGFLGVAYTLMCVAPIFKNNDEMGGALY